MIQEALLGIVLELVVFLELSGSDVVDQDAAIEQLENIVARLDELPIAERNEVVDLIRAQARQAAAANERQEVIECMDGLAEDLGPEWDSGEDS